MKPLVFRGERLIEETKNIDGQPALILQSPKGWYILREWDKMHGWGDRSYRTMERARFFMMGALKNRKRGNMATALANTRKSVEHVVQAFLAHRKARAGGKRYFTDGTVLEVWGNVVARWLPEGIELRDAGWRTPLTKQMLNAILHSVGSVWSIGQEKFAWYLYKYPPGGGKPEKREWKGTATIKDPRGASTVEGNKPKSKKGTYYFPSYEEARDYASKHGFPKDRIIRYGLGWAIQLRKSGPYVGKHRRKNPLTKRESAKLLHDARGWVRAGKVAKRRFGDAEYHRGRADGITQAVWKYGPRKAHRAAKKIGARAGFLLNHVRSMKNLHTAEERAKAKKLIESYFVMGRNAMHAGNVVRAAHCYGAIAAIRHIARNERAIGVGPVVNLASFRLDILRNLRKDLAKSKTGMMRVRR
ncbi:MAG: hypothetical protein ACREYE_22190 [Gammaproteobacteria bacterium]